MQGGRLEPDLKQSAKPKGGLARWAFDDGRPCCSRKAKEKRAGVWVWPVTRRPRRRSPGSGPTPSGSAAGVGRRSRRHKSMRLHGFLRDQRAIAGIGRRLSSEICWRAKLSPFASTTSSTPDEIDRLRAALAACIDDALAYERGRDGHELVGRAAGRGPPARPARLPVCGDTIRAVEYNAYTVNYCPTCQTGGKVLADNTTSKFLK